MVTDISLKLYVGVTRAMPKIGLAKFYPVSGVHKRHRQMADDRQQTELP